jgi:hypothetical protein
MYVGHKERERERQREGEREGMCVVRAQGHISPAQAHVTITNAIQATSKAWNEGTASTRSRLIVAMSNLRVCAFVHVCELSMRLCVYLYSYVCNNIAMTRSRLIVAVDKMRACMCLQM